MRNPYQPGATVGRDFRNFVPGSRPDRMYNAYADVYYAAVFGYGHTRQPRPGTAIDLARYTSWKKRAMSATRNIGSRRTLREDDFTENQWQAMFLDMVAIKDGDA